MLRVSSQGNMNVALSGELLFTDHLQFKAMLEQALASRSDAAIEFDLSGLAFIDSAGLGMLLIARDELNEISRPFILKAPSGQVKRMFDISRFETLFTIQP